MGNREKAESKRAALISAAQAASEAAYAPYSQFSVGAAVLLQDGAIITGCNIENASYGLTVCAERVAIFTTVASGHLDIAAVAVYTSASSIASPCGACRQVIAEFSDPADPLIVIIANELTSELLTIDELLPRSFSLS